MGTFETFDHTADVGLRVAGSDLDDLFRTAARGLMGLIAADPGAIRPEEPEPLEVEADDLPELFRLWLDELLFRVETRHRVYADFRVRVDPSGRRLSAEILGEPIDPDRHRPDHEVKAVTHHGLFVERSADGTGWVAEVIVDI